MESSTGRVHGYVRTHWTSVGETSLHGDRICIPLRVSLKSPSGWGGTPLQLLIVGRTRSSRRTSFTIFFRCDLHLASRQISHNADICMRDQRMRHPCARASLSAASKLPSPDYTDAQMAAEISQTPRRSSIYKYTYTGPLCANVMSTF